MIGEGRTRVIVLPVRVLAHHTVNLPTNRAQECDHLPAAFWAVDRELLPGLWAMLVRRDASVRGQETYANSVLTLSSWILALTLSMASTMAFGVHDRP